MTVNVLNTQGSGNVSLNSSGGSGGNVIIGGSGGNVIITAGNATGNGYITIGPKTDKDTVTVTEKPKRWGKVICWLLGHKEEPKANISAEFLGPRGVEISIPYNGKTYKREYCVCKRCGIFYKDTITYEKPLTEDEKIIKDIIT